jgi:hypothetical protein
MPEPAKINIGNNQQFVANLSQQAIIDLFKNNCGNDPTVNDSCAEMHKLIQEFSRVK